MREAMRLLEVEKQKELNEKLHERLEEIKRLQGELDILRNAAGKVQPSRNILSSVAAAPATYILDRNGTSSLKQIPQQQQHGQRNIQQ